MKIIVTGGAGFIGSHLVKRLIQENHDVYVIDCLHPYYSPQRKKKQLENVASFGSFHFFQKDLLDREEMVTIFKQISPHVVVHLAALPGVAYSIEEPLKYVDYDIKATINVLEASGKAGVSKIVFASSSSVYGNQSGPFKEEMANGKVISPYAASKYSAESYCHVYEYLYGFQVNILRFFTVYGPWGRPDMAIGSFIKKLMNGEGITLFGDGRARDFTYIDDIVNGIYLSINQLMKSEVINIGSGRPILMDTLLAELKRHFPDMKINKEASRVGDVVNTWADISKAKQLLGFEPKVDFIKGLSETVKWAKENETIL
ncbi:NAD-dependent epimerase/dehydratase family protein [Peribacillus butanolivorans]|uniref:NAD-dependent epimerase/dehydratase family protein n=1 Tax=Peribacillus butanolivorans TaxID=421767 RepID=UPI00207D3F22|nr:NAD-dependent epimerase/dehydratase family protein [Peribacillus butanolivorans]MCO0599084.1 NAD-dependent epimerase/dehydratase family protein [Peribacillus butanolivorans]